MPAHQSAADILEGFSSSTFFAGTSSTLLKTKIVFFRASDGKGSRGYWAWLGGSDDSFAFGCCLHTHDTIFVFFLLPPYPIRRCGQGIFLFQGVVCVPIVVGRHHVGFW
jgi:hypothetical protein